MEKHQLFFGRNVLKEAALQGLKIQKIFFESDSERKWLQDNKLNKFPLQQGLPKSLRGTGNSNQDIAFELAHDFYLDALPQNLDKAFPRILLLNHIEDVQNLGAISRSAAAFGFNLVVHEKTRSVSMNPVAAKISMGHAFRIKFYEVANLTNILPKLRDEGFEVAGLSSEAKMSLFEWNPSTPLALVLGSESEGLARPVEKQLDHHLSISMEAGVESLNVSQAASIAMSWIHHRC